MAKQVATSAAHSSTMAARVEKNAGCDDHSYTMLHEITGQRGQSIVLVLCPAVLDRNVLVRDVTAFVEPPTHAGTGTVSDSGDPKLK
jgi:hypothetical protein